MGNFDCNYFAEMCRGSEERSYLRLIDICPGLRVIKKKEKPLAALAAKKLLLPGLGPEKWTRHCLVANRATLPQKWPPPPWNVADSCELVVTNNFLFLVAEW